MRYQRRAAAIGLIAAGALLFSACGSDNAGGEGGGQAAGGVACGGKRALRSSGSTAQANAMTRFVTAYETVCPGQTLNYTSNGSGAGRNEFIGGQTDFGGSDSALAPEQTQPAAQRCAGSPAWNLPVVFGPLAITYNLPGITDLVLDGPTAAKIFNGQITTWNDPAVAAINPGKALPAIPVAVVFRSDQSGTTDNFQKYLEAASNGIWTQGDGQTFNGGVGSGARGNEGTSAAIKTAPGSITYNEWSFAKQQQLTYAQIINSGGGQPVVLTAESAGAAIGGAQFQGQGNDLVLNLDSIYKANAPGAYPIALATYEIVCSRYPDPQVAQAVKAFLTTALNQGQQGLADNGYIPLPDQFKQRLTTAVSAIA